MVYSLMNSLMDAADLYIEFADEMGNVLEGWDVKHLFASLVNYRRTGQHHMEGMAYDVRPLYFLLVGAMNEQIAREDPHWFDDHPDARATLDLMSRRALDGLLEKEKEAEAGAAASAPPALSPGEQLHAAGLA